MISILDKKNCCGCTACASICPKDAIYMKPDACGFLYPQVDNDKCIKCGLCDTICPFNDEYEKSLNFAKPLVYGARHKDLNEVMKSRSGAAFVAISDLILDSGGVVYGAGYTENFRVVHKRAIDKQGRDEFRGSKYVQSDLSGIFRQVRDDLKNGMVVLFSGTPCQTSGLNKFIGSKLRENLLLVDIVCHGVPGPYIWRDYLKYVEKKCGKKIKSVDFRDKQDLGWKSHYESLTLDDGKKFVSREYTNLFYKHIMLRYSCEVCHFCNITRPSDITLADFWGWEKTDEDFNKDDKGCSLILVNTDKGKQTFDIIKSKLNLIYPLIENCMQGHLKSPTVFDKRREEFEKYYKKKGFEKTLKKYGRIKLGVRIKKIIKKIFI